MPFYEISGKWFHLQYSHHFERVVKAASPKAALYKFAKDVSEVPYVAELEWHRKPLKVVETGVQNPEPILMVGDDQIYEVRKITVVRLAEVECTTCKGTGHTETYVDVETGFIGS